MAPGAPGFGIWFPIINHLRQGHTSSWDWPPELCPGPGRDPAPRSAGRSWLPRLVRRVHSFSNIEHFLNAGATSGRVRQGPGWLCLHCRSGPWPQFINVRITLPGQVAFKSKISHQNMGNSLAVQWLGLGAFTARVIGSIPGGGTKIPQAAWPKN